MKIAVALITAGLVGSALADTVVPADPAKPKNESELIARLSQMWWAEAPAHKAALENAGAGEIGKRYFWGDSQLAGEITAVSRNGDCTRLHEHFPFKVKDAGWDFDICKKADGFHIIDK